LSFDLPRSHDAAFSAAINLDNLARRPCTKGTRVDIIAQIMAWVNEKDPAKAPPVYWLTGLAGLGKTTIAYTICELLKEARLPFVSFFCSLQLDSRNSKLLITTLCRDLAELYNPYAAQVLSILKTNAKIVGAGLRIQIDELLVKPWQASIALQKDLPTSIVVVDALDESDRGTEFLEELLRVIHVGQLAGIKFLVTSRPDPKIVDLCNSFPPNAVCKLHEVDTANVQNDIEKYLREALPELKDKPELTLLSQRAGGLFIYATTAVRFISPQHSPPSVSEMRSHLQTMLDPEPLTMHANSNDRLLVDELYERILCVAFRDARVRAPRLRILHTIVCAKSSINMSVLADLTNTDLDTVKRVVESLHAVLFVSPKDGCVYWYHASFPDFLFSQARARISTSPHWNLPTQTFDVFCDAPTHHTLLAQQCFCVMQESLHFNMCNLPSSYVFDSEVPGLNASINKTITPTLQYVSRHWARHLLWAVPVKNDADNLLCGLEKFLSDKLLFWMEVMNLLGVKSECFSLLKNAELWLERVRMHTITSKQNYIDTFQEKKWPDLLAQLADATNFSAFFAGSPASKSTPHLYISALSMWNQDSSIWRNWRDRFGFIPSISLPKGSITIPLLTISMACSVKSISFSPDGNQIVSGSNKSVQVWDAKTGEQLKKLQGHTRSVNSVRFSPDGNQIVSGSSDKSVCVWDTKTGEQLRELQGHTDKVRSVGFSPDGHQIVSGSYDRSVRVWDAKTGKQLRELQGHTGMVTSVEFSPDGNQIVSGSHDTSVWMWDAKAGKHLRELQGHTSWVTSVGFSPNGNQIVSASSDESVRIWDAKTGNQLRELQGHTSWVRSVRFSPDGNQIVSGSRDKSVQVWDAKTGEQLRELQGHTSWVNSVGFSPDGNQIVSGSGDKSVCVWNAKTDEQLRELQGHADWVSSVGFSPDGNQIVSGSGDKSVQVWDAKTGKHLRELQGHIDWVTSVGFSPDGNQIVSGSGDKSVWVWNAKTGKQLRELQGHTDWITSVEFSPDGNQIVSGSRDNSVRVWDAKTGEQLSKLQGHTDWVTSVGFSPDGNQIVSGSSDKSVRVWDAKTGEQLRELQGHTSWVTSVGFSPDGNQTVSGSGDKSVQVCDAKTGKQLRELQGHTDWVTSVRFSPDSNQIVSGSSDKSVWIWDAKTGKQLRELQGHTDWVTSVGFSPDGNQIVPGSNDASVRVWTNLNLDVLWIMDKDGWILAQKDLFGSHPLSAMSCFVLTTYLSYLAMALQQSLSHNVNLGPSGMNVILLRCC